MQLSVSLTGSRDLPPQSRDQLVTWYLWSRDLSVMSVSCVSGVSVCYSLQGSGSAYIPSSWTQEAWIKGLKMANLFFVIFHYENLVDLCFLSFDTLNTMRISIFTEYPIIMRFSRKFVYGIICFCHSDYNQSKCQKPIEETFNLTIIWYLMIDSWGTFYSESGKIENWGQCE